MVSKKRKNKILSKITVTGVICYTIMIIACISVILPFLHEFAKSFSHPFEVDTGHVLFTPRDFTFGSYKFFFVDQWETLSRHLRNTLFLVTVGGSLSVAAILLFAFPLSRPKKEFRLGSLLIYMVVFCIIVQKPLIPTRITFQMFGLLDSLWAIILNMPILPFGVVLAITYFKEIPDDLFDAAKVDGANDMTTFIRIVLPLCGALIATLFLLQSIGFWNSFLQAKLLIVNVQKLPIQNYIFNVINLGASDESVDYIRNPFAQSESIKSALLMITTIPPTIAYLSLQKYFKPGFATGAVKG